MKKKLTKTYLQELNYKWKQGTLTTQEQLLLDEWEANLDDTILRLPEEFKDQPTIIRDRITKNVLTKVRAETTGLLTKLWPRIAIAATIAIAVTGVALLYYQANVNQTNSGKLAYKNDIAPGKSGATLTLADGKKIRLTDATKGEIANESGISVNKTADGQLVYVVNKATTGDDQINILSTAKGETYQLRLPDGSKVWLNAASSLTYMAKLNQHGKRKVKLEGEAYFEISKDKAHPFVVSSKGQEVEVLGTHFNVNAYADEPVLTTTLLEGSVKVTNGGLKEIIKPGEQAINNGKNIKTMLANMENVMDWKDGDFFLNHVNFKTAMRKIARWYDVEVIYDVSIPDDMEAGGWISRNKPLSTVLQSIESSGLVKFKVEGRKIYVSK